MLVRIPYGAGILEEEVPELEGAAVIEASHYLPQEDAGSSLSLYERIRLAVANPLHALRLRDQVRADDRIAIIVNDATRPCPTKEILDVVLEECAAAQITTDRVTVIIATGAHRAPTPEELDVLLGSHQERLRVVAHDARDQASLVDFGEVGAGLPLLINREVAHATRRIIVSTVAPHHSAGFSGGRKMILPGVAGMASIRYYHSFPVQPRKPVLGMLAGNAAHEVALYAAQTVGVDFSINVVTAPGSGEVVAVTAGDLDKAHTAAAAQCARYTSVAVPTRADLTICSPGGYPRDINLHQAQKALSVAEMVTRQGGTIILVAECRKGIDGSFARWLQASRVPQEVIAQYAEEGWSESSGKAMMFARALTNHQIIVVSGNLSTSELAELFMHHRPSLRAAVKMARIALGKDEIQTNIIPYASSLIPLVGKEKELSCVNTG